MMERRSILKAGLAAGLAPALYGAAQAQDASRSRDIMHIVAVAKGQAENLLASALYAKLSPESARAVPPSTLRSWSRGESAAMPAY